MKIPENHWFSGIFLFAPTAQPAQNIETAGVQKGGNEICVTHCHLQRRYFVIFQYIAKEKVFNSLPPCGLL
ncbi:MAG: hypothetical protein NC453_02760 [Muribaculum sp.]|nr:hypothetical protein [Muribaculum sp.]